MIIYKGISITDVAPADIADIVVSGVKRNVVARERMTHAGSVFVRVTDQTRQVTITLANRTNDPDTRLSEIDAINAWAAGDQPGKLVLPYRDGKYLMALCTSFVEPSYRQWWDSKLKLVFTCYAGGRVELLKYKGPEGSRLTGMAVRDVVAKLGCDVLVCTVERGNDVYIADGNFGGGTTSTSPTVISSSPSGISSRWWHPPRTPPTFSAPSATRPAPSRT